MCGSPTQSEVKELLLILIYCPAQAEEICAFGAGVKGVKLSPLLKQDPYIHKDLLYLPLEYLEQNNLFLSAEL